MQTAGMRVGELAKRTGLTVRTLHHYDEIGLLSPMTRTESGHRLYGTADVERLQQIVSLRQLGLSLDEIREVLDDEQLSLLNVIELQIERVQGLIRSQQRLQSQLSVIADRLRQNGAAPVEELLRTMEMISMAEKYYTEEQLEYLRKRREEVGEERIREVEAEWPRLMAEVRAELDAGTDPSDPKLQPLLDRWFGLVAEFTGGNPGIEKSLNSFYENEDSMADGQQIDRELFDYVGKAMAARKQ